VVDGDTIDVLIDGDEFRVRYIGIDTPESGQCFWSEASLRNRELVEGKTVGLEKDLSETDHFNRLLRYVWVSTGSGQARMVDAVLVEEGFATAVTYPPDVRYADLFVRLQEEARAAGRGLWSGCATPASPAPSDNCDPSYPDVCIPVGSEDYDCAGGSGDGPNYITGPLRVLPPDPHHLDGNGDGIGCERG
jgi:micrococcal nuclease